MCWFSSYVDDEQKKNMAVTQFEPLEARSCFPCWDEPGLKASFKITLDVPSDLIALSNMPVSQELINGNLKTVYYHESPVMSTYLVAIVVGRSYQ
uniref:Aminopeptidase N-like N-terminal domain-containing protein n=1 Tax=Kalanchoe fedtschenkoi TaxID=63787 RepID=A0A7N0V8J7_KALFE